MASSSCTIISINASLTLDSRILNVKLGKKSTPAIYKVVQRSQNVLDSSIYTKSLLNLNFISRLSSSELTTLKQIFTDGEATITLGDWTFTGWFRKKNIVWDYRKESEERPWKVTFTFDVSNYNYPICVSGEHVTNGGFETGDWTGWTHSSGTSGIGSSYPHTGTYHARLWSNYLGGDDWEYGWMKQEFSEPIPTKCIIAFEFWARIDQADSNIKITIHYNDGAETIIEDSVTSLSYTKFNYLNNLASNKMIKWIKIEYTGGLSGSNVDFDDVSIITMSEEIPEILNVAQFDTLEFNARKTNQEAIAQFISENPEIQTDIWNRSIEQIEYSFECSDGELKKCLDNVGEIVTLTDNIYGVNGNAWLYSVEGNFRSNQSKPWLVRIITYYVG